LNHGYQITGRTHEVKSIVWQYLQFCRN
jgi:hypothetical protein